MQFAGKRPVLTDGLGDCLSDLPSDSRQAFDTSPLLRITSDPIRDATILIAPVPYFSTQSATVSLRPVSASINGFLTTIIGSWLGLSEVPKPEYCLAKAYSERLSNALLTSCDLGNPEKYKNSITSRTSNPANRKLIVIKSCVRVPANTSA